MAWRVIKNFFLALLEYGLKISAFWGALIAISIDQSFLDKFLGGLASVGRAFQNLPEAYQSTVEVGRVIHHYNTLDSAAFTDLHGPAALDGVMRTLNEGALYFYGIEQNVMEAPFVTMAAALLVFSMFFGTGWIVRIVRQGDDDLLLVRMEKKLWSMLITEAGDNLEAGPGPENEDKTLQNASEEQEKVTPEEIEESWSTPLERSKTDQKQVVKADGESGSRSVLEVVESAGVDGNPNDDGHEKEFSEADESTEVSSLKELPQEAYESPMELWKDEEEEQTDDFQLESELESAMEENEAVDNSNKNRVQENSVNGSLETEATDSDSQKTSLTERINKAKKSKKHSLEEFLNMARSSG